MKTREEIIDSMCMTWRHDYNLVVERHEHPFNAGMTVDERVFLYNQMAQIFDNDIAPYVNIKKDRKPRRDKSLMAELGYSRVGYDAMRRGR
jgi:hypothetical protein